MSASDCQQKTGHVEVITVHRVKSGIQKHLMGTVSTRGLCAASRPWVHTLVSEKYRRTMFFRDKRQ